MKWRKHMKKMLIVFLTTLPMASFAQTAKGLKDYYRKYFPIGAAVTPRSQVLSTARAGGFVGSVFGLYATSLGKPSSTKAAFDWFEYKGNDPVFD